AMVPDQGIVACLQLADTPDKRMRAHGCLISQELPQHSGIQYARYLSGGEYAPHLGGKYDTRIGDSVIQRLFAKPVAGQEERLLCGIPDRQGKHAVEAIQT